MKLLRWGIALGSCVAAMLWVSPALAATQQASLGDVARQVREQKKAAPKAKQVWTNDSLPASPQAAVSVVGSAVEAPAATPALAGPAGAAEAEGKEKEREGAEAEVRQEKEHLARAKQELELLQRDFDLQRQQYYSSPQYQSDSAGKARLDGLTAQIEAKRQQVQQAEQKIADLEQKLKGLDHTLGPRKEGPPTPDQQREAWAARIRALRDDLQRVEAEIERMRTDAASRGLTLYGVTAGGSMTADRLQQLESQRLELERRIAEMEEAARRAAVPMSWVR